MNDLREILKLADSLSQHLEKFKANSVYDINLFEKPKIEETHITYLLYKILDYEQSGEKITYRRLVETFLPKIKDQISKPEIISENAYNIDILIKDTTYAIIIENKIFGAEFQRNQLARNIKRVLNWGYSKEQIHIVIIPKNNEEKYLDSIRSSVWRLPPDWEMPNQCRKCVATDQYNCLCDVSERSCNNKGCIYMSEYKEQAKVINNVKIAQWLDECLMQINEKEILLRSSIIQVSDYIKYINNSKMDMEAQEFLKEKFNSMEFETEQKKLEKIAKYLTNLETLQNTLNSIKEKPSRYLIKLWAKNLKNQWELYIEQDSFYIEIQLEKISIKCGCWSGCGNGDKYDKCPYCGFYIDSQIINDQKRNRVIELVKKDIVNQTIHADDFQFNKLNKTSKGFICYMKTFEGDEVCKKLFVQAQNLGCIKQRHS